MKEPSQSKIIQELEDEIERKPSQFVKILNYFTIVSTILCYGIIIYLLIFHFELIRLFFSDYNKLQDFITPGLKIPIFLVALLFSVILSIYPFPQVIPLTSMMAFFYGFKGGLLFGSLSFFISTYLIIVLSRHLGNTVVKRIIGEKNWKRANILANEEGILPFFIIYLFPIFPNSIISWVAGVTKIPVFKLSFSALIAQLPGIAISVLIGSGLVTKNIYLTGGMFVTLVAIAFLMNKNRKRILNFINRNKE
jgi:uncharacterized membrane protein YdjX (TVP38/TMEM64 family)